MLPPPKNPKNKQTKNPCRLADLETTTTTPAKKKHPRTRKQASTDPPVPPADRTQPYEKMV